MMCLLTVGFPLLKQEADESLNFEEQILEAAKSIAAATSALVKAASAAQRELVAQGKVRLTQYMSTIHNENSAVGLSRHKAHVHLFRISPPSIGFDIYLSVF